MFNLWIHIFKTEGENQEPSNEEPKSSSGETKDSHKRFSKAQARQRFKKGKGN